MNGLLRRMKKLFARQPKYTPDAAILREQQDLRSQREHERQLMRLARNDYMNTLMRSVTDEIRTQR